jgi:UPF0755 protein
MNIYNHTGLKRRWPKILLITAGILVVLFFAGFFVANRLYAENLKPLSASQKSHIVVITTGVTAKEVAGMLEDRELIRSAWAFEWYLRSSGLRDRLQAGSYTLRPNQSTQEIVHILTQSGASADLITVLPVKRVDEVRGALIEAGFQEADVDAALDPALYSSHPALADKPPAASLEGYLYPESFHRAADTTPQDIIKLSLDEMAKRLTAEVREGIRRQGLSVHQGIILASILELEIGDTDEQQDLEDKRKVAQVFLRRLKEDKALESNATTFYGAVLDGRQRTYRSMERASFTYQTPYNTYLNKGLPPTPASNVSANALRAVSNPANTGFLYFFSGDDRKNYFSASLAEHEQLMDVHCKKCER